MSFPTPADLFMTAVRDGDIGFVETALENIDEQPLELENMSLEGLVPLSLAVKNGHKLIVQQLLKHGVRFGDSLLRAVDSEFFDAVALICKYAESDGPEILKEVTQCTCEGDEYHTEITPIMLACHSANYNIIKLLLSYGARVPEPGNDLSKTERNTLQHSVGILNIYRALSCGMYIALTSLDPIETAFILCDKLRKLSISEYEFRSDYTTLRENVEKFAATMLGQARNSKELEIVMRKRGIDQGINVSMNGPAPKLAQAVYSAQKRFVAHPHCHQLLMSQFNGTYNSSTVHHYWLILILVTVGYPFLAVAYLVFPDKSIAAFMKIPKVKFQMDMGSRVTFLFIVFISSTHMAGNTDKSVAKLPLGAIVIIAIWILGRTWAEICAFIREGSSRKLDNTNYADFIILILYWLCVVLSMVTLFSDSSNASLSRVERHVQSPVLEKYQSIENNLLPKIHDTFESAVDNTKLALEEDLRRNLHRIGDFFKEAGMEFRTKDTDATPNGTAETWAMAAFAAATTASFLRLLVLFISSQFLGPLQISLGGMFDDISKFLVVFVVVWAAFAVGLNAILHVYEETQLVICQNSYPGAVCRQGPFYDILSSMAILFWSLFGLVDLGMLDTVPEEHVFTKQLVRILFGTYMMVAVVVMLNALIAMMSNTYTRVEEDSDTEWKYARAKMWLSFLQPYGVVPPPFNLIPGVEDIRKLHDFFREKCLGDRSKEKETKDRRKQSSFDIDFACVVKELVERYIIEETAVGSDAVAEVTRKDIMSIRTDIAIFKYEAFKSLKVTNKIHSDLCSHLSSTKGKLIPAGSANKTATSILDKITQSRNLSSAESKKAVKYLSEYAEQLRCKLGVADTSETDDDEEVAHPSSSDEKHNPTEIKPVTKRYQIGSKFEPQVSRSSSFKKRPTTMI